MTTEIKIDEEDVYRIELIADVAAAMKRDRDSWEGGVDEATAYTKMAAVALDIALPRQTDHIAEMVVSRAPATAWRIRNYANDLRNGTSSG